MLNCYEIGLFICIKMDLALNNLQWLIHHHTHTYIYFPSFSYMYFQAYKMHISLRIIRWYYD